MDPILETIDAALKRKGLTDSAASKLAVGHPSLIKNLRMPREGEKRYNLPSLMKLAAVLDLEFHFGPARSPEKVEHVVVAGADYVSIPLHDAVLSAGAGSLNDESAIISQLSFRHDWLTKVGVSPKDASMARVSGDSMAPGIQSGDLVLIDTTKTTVPIRRRLKGSKVAPIFAFVQDGEARVKRIERPDAQLLVLMSDNPAYPTELVTDPLPESITILGQVVWSGHVWR